MRQKWLQKPPLGTPINWSHPSAKGLVGFWVFQEGGGDLVNDLSGNANHGTLKSMAFPPTTVSGWNPGKFGSCLFFDGSNDYVDCGNDSSLDITGAITIETWVKANTIVAYDTIVRKTSAYTFRLYEGKPELYMWGLTDTNTISATILNTGQWYHLVYIDGILDITDDSSGSIAISADDLVIGIRRGTLGSLWDGQIDQVRIYNRALSEAEILDSYLDPFGMFERNNLWDYVTAPPAGVITPYYYESLLAGEVTA